MSTRSRQTVLALGLAGLLVEAVVSHPAFAVGRVTLFKVVSPQNEIVIGLTKAELAQMPGKTPDAVEKALRSAGALQVWQYGVRRGVSGVMEQAPVRKIEIAADPATHIESYLSPLKVVSVTDEILTEAIQ
ncbi:hypothetical protein HNQ36_004428 [Afipia massiliensis]|uniref:Uncharacterized protein n=1 Tax=Afipia massiliensis TaxID=211460 RepID=A0A840NCL5_9BRAD|nr:hypothetical protein [Afipia massiliensis]MBB5054426.1 hypothetical protein [Afipia massiliensis]